MLFQHEVTKNILNSLSNLLKCEWTYWLKPKKTIYTPVFNFFLITQKQIVCIKYVFRKIRSMVVICMAMYCILSFPITFTLCSVCCSCFPAFKSSVSMSPSQLMWTVLLFFYGSVWHQKLIANTVLCTHTVMANCFKFLLFSMLWHIWLFPTCSWVAGEFKIPGWFAVITLFHYKTVLIPHNI